MTTQQQTERERLAKKVLFEPSRLHHYELVRIADFLRGDEPAKPDRYVEVTRELWNTYTSEGTYDGGIQAAAAVLRRHFEPPISVVEAARMVKEHYSGGAYPHSITLADHILKGDQ